MPALACFGCGKANVRYWRERERLRLRPYGEIVVGVSGRRQGDRATKVDSVSDDLIMLPVHLNEAEADELAARIIRYDSVRYNGISHHAAMQVVRLFYE